MKKMKEEVLYPIYYHKTNNLHSLKGIERYSLKLVEASYFWQIRIVEQLQEAKTSH